MGYEVKKKKPMLLMKKWMTMKPKNLYVATCLGALEEELGWIIGTDCSNYIFYNDE